MAVIPDKLKEKSLEILNKLEEYFDEKLLSSRLDGRGQVINITLPRDIPMNMFHLQALKPKYTSVGWRSIEWVYDQRDGDYIRFTY